MGLRKGFPGTGNIGPKTAGNREHWLKNSREQGTLVLKQPGTGNTGLKTAGNREHKAKKSREQGTFCNFEPGIFHFDHDHARDIPLRHC